VGGGGLLPFATWAVKRCLVCGGMDRGEASHGRRTGRDEKGWDDGAKLKLVQGSREVEKKRHAETKEGRLVKTALLRYPFKENPSSRPPLGAKFLPRPPRRKKCSRVIEGLLGFWALGWRSGDPKLQGILWVFRHRRVARRG
jgi:hypothetical protein